MDFQNRTARPSVRKIQRDLAVKTPRALQRGVQHVGTIGGRQHHHGLRASIEESQCRKRRVAGLAGCARFGPRR